MIEFQPYIHHGKELEMAVLGAFMLESSAFGVSYGIINESTFYYEGHKTVYRAISEMYENHAGIDVETVTYWLISKHGVKEINGDNTAYFVTRLTNSVVSTAHLEFHCYCLQEMWQRRELLILKARPVTDGINPNNDIKELNEGINRILGQRFKQDWYDMSELMYNLMLHRQEMQNGQKAFLTTGFRKIDQVNGGFYNGQLIVIGARPSVGKSAFMGQMALGMARSGKKVGIVSLEMSNTEIAARLSAIETGVNFDVIFQGLENESAETQRFYVKAGMMEKLPLFVSDKTKVNVTDIKAKATKLKATKGCDCIIIDYLQLVDGTASNRNYNREQEVANISRGLKLMAVEMDIPVILLAQLNRESTKATYANRFPKLDHLRESGAIEQDADVVMFIHRDWMAGFENNPETNESTESEADIIGAKWRNGRLFHLPVGFDGPKMKFVEDKNSMSELPSGNWKPVPGNFYEREKED